MNNFLEKIKSKNIHIVGVSGTEGSAVLEFLIKNGIKKITAHDFSRDQEEFKNNFFKTHLWLKGKEKNKAFREFLQLPINLKLKDKYLEGISEADAIFAPSSWYLYKPNFPELLKSKEKGIEFTSLTKLYFELAKGKIISVTGTKGKGTTSRLIYEILLKSGKKKNVYLAGNDRRSAQELDKISKTGKDDILVLETSNRQLMIDLSRSPDIGVITNISPDHIDEHGSFEEYIEVKKSLFKYAGKDNVAVLNYGNEITKKFGEELIRRGVSVFFFSRKGKIENGAYAENGKIYISRGGAAESILNLSDTKLVGEHNIENILAAVLVGYLAGAKPEQIKSAVRNFQGLPHRLEFIGEYDGARFYDDIASTNPESTIAAMRVINDLRIILVAGGDDKGMEFSNLAKEIAGKVDILILLPGTGSDIIKNMTSDDKQKKLKIFECNDFLKAMEIIKAQMKTGDIVLISPACAHFQARYIDVLKKPIRNIIVEKFR